MAAPDEYDSATEAPQPAGQEEETKTFKDLVSVDDAGSSLYCWHQAQTESGSLTSWLAVYKSIWRLAWHYLRISEAWAPTLSLNLRV